MDLDEGRQSPGSFFCPLSSPLKAQFSTKLCLQPISLCPHGYFLPAHASAVERTSEVTARLWPALVSRSLRAGSPPNAKSSAWHLVRVKRQWWDGRLVPRGTSALPCCVPTAFPFSLGQSAVPFHPTLMRGAGGQPHSLSPLSFVVFPASADPDPGSHMRF